MRILTTHIIIAVLVIGANCRAEIPQGVALPTDKNSCEKSGGRWWTLRSRMVPSYKAEETSVCSIPTTDANKECKSSSDCQSKTCLADENLIPGKPASGHCVGWLGIDPAGADCWQKVENGIAGTRVCI